MGTVYLLMVCVIYSSQAEVLTILKGGMELVSTFTTQMSTFHSYLEQVILIVYARMYGRIINYYGISLLHIVEV